MKSKRIISLGVVLALVISIVSMVPVYAVSYASGKSSNFNNGTSTTATSFNARSIYSNRQTLTSSSVSGLFGKTEGDYSVKDAVTYIGSGTLNGKYQGDLGSGSTAMNTGWPYVTSFMIAFEGVVKNYNIQIADTVGFVKLFGEGNIYNESGSIVGTYGNNQWNKVTIEEPYGSDKSGWYVKVYVNDVLVMNLKKTSAGAKKYSFTCNDGTPNALGWAPGYAVYYDDLIRGGSEAYVPSTMTVTAKENKGIVLADNAGASNTGLITISGTTGKTVSELKDSLNIPADAIVKIFKSDMLTEITDMNAKVSGGDIVAIASKNLEGEINEANSISALYKYYTVDAPLTFDNGTDEIVWSQTNSDFFTQTYEDGKYGKTTGDKAFFISGKTVSGTSTKEDLTITLINEKLKNMLNAKQKAGVEFAIAHEGNWSSHNSFVLSANMSVKKTEDGTVNASHSPQLMRSNNAGDVIVGQGEWMEWNWKQLQPRRWARIAIEFDPENMTYTIYKDGVALKGKNGITEIPFNLDPEAYTFEGINDIKLSIYHSNMVVDTTVAIDNYSVFSGEYDAESVAINAYVNSDYIAIDNKNGLVYFDGEITGTELINTINLPEGTIGKVYSDNTYTTEVTDDALVVDYVMILISNDKNTMQYYTVKELPGLFDKDVVFKYGNEVAEEVINGTLVATVSPRYRLNDDEVAPTAILLVAVYNSDGSLDEIEMSESKTILETSTEFSVPVMTEKGQTVKAFMWDSTINMVPYIEASNLPVVE